MAFSCFCNTTAGKWSSFSRSLCLCVVMCQQLVCFLCWRRKRVWFYLSTLFASHIVHVFALSVLDYSVFCGRHARALSKEVPRHIHIAMIVHGKRQHLPNWMSAMFIVGKPGIFFPAEFRTHIIFIVRLSLRLFNEKLSEKN